MYEERYTRTWETLLVPDNKSRKEVLDFLEEKKVLGDPALAKSRH
jgi:hypothetical protein